MAACQRPFACRGLGLDLTPPVAVVLVADTGGSLNWIFDTDMVLPPPAVLLPGFEVSHDAGASWHAVTVTGDDGPTTLLTQKAGISVNPGDLWRISSEDTLLTFVNGGRVFSPQSGVVDS